MDVPVDASGNPQNVITVQNVTTTIPYKYGTDYTIVPMGQYHQYGLLSLPSPAIITNISIDGNDILTVTAVNNYAPLTEVVFSELTNATFLSGQSVIVTQATATSFTANFIHATYSGGDSGIASGYNIVENQSLSVTYNKFIISERLEFITAEQVTLTGTTATPLANNGFVYNTWLPESYGDTTLLYDGMVLNTAGAIDPAQSTGLIGAGVPYYSRYIKVTYNGNVMREGVDFTISVDSTSGAASLTRVLASSGGHIDDGGTVLVSYFVNEVFDVATQYPSFVELLANQIATTKHAAADVLVKSMMANPVDITLTVALKPSANTSVIDPQIRTIIGITLDNAGQTLYQSELIRQVQSITGVASVEIPLIKCAKSDGSYNVGVVVPTQTSWLPLNSITYTASNGNSVHVFPNAPSSAYISEFPLLPDDTKPSGGDADSFVGMLYEGEPFRRAMSVYDFTSNSTSTNPPSFYIIGTGDVVNDPTLSQPYPLDYSYARRIMITTHPSIPPALRSYLVTYQVFGEGGAKDIVLSSTEYLVAGRISINYLVA
jgi:hypothetical protein